MECKGPQVYLSAGTAQVLIETSWNVKISQKRKECHLQFRINRNIVECKDKRDSKNPKPLKVLIETSWNVKFLVGVWYDSEHGY